MKSVMTDIPNTITIPKEAKIHGDLLRKLEANYLTLPHCSKMLIVQTTSPARETSGHFKSSCFSLPFINLEVVNIIKKSHFLEYAYKN